MRFMRLALIGVVLVLVSCGGGLSPTSTDAVAEVAYNVGDTGPGGGIIVYVDEAGFDYSGRDSESIGAICPTETCRYIEMAPTDLEGEYSWDDAIAAAEAFSTPSANDWVLPSADALNEVCKFAFGDTVNDICNDDGAGDLWMRDDGFSTGGYWSSSEVNGTTARFQGFIIGYQEYSLKNYPSYVRPVRAF